MMLVKNLLAVSLLFLATSACGSPQHVVGQQVADDIGDDPNSAATGDDEELDALPHTPLVEETVEGGDISVPPPTLTLSWQQLQDADAVELAGGVAVLSVASREPQEENVLVELGWVGDLGTTRSYFGALEPVLLEADAGSQLEIEIDLGEILPSGEMQHSGYLHVVANILLPDGQSEQLVGPELYFHRDDSATLAYTEDGLRNQYRAGDFRQLLDESAALEDPEMDSRVVRIISHEQEEGLQAPVSSSPEEAPGLRGLGPNAPNHPAPTTPPDESAQTGQQRAPFSHALCVNWRVQTVDSGSTNSVGITEDFWTLGNTGITTPGYGVRVDIGTATYDTDSAGCIGFTSSRSNFTSNVRVYAYVTDTNDNFLRMHDGPSNSTGAYPGSTYSLLFTNIPFTTGSVTTLGAGNYGARWTAFASLAHSLWFYNDGVTSTEYHVSDLGGKNPENDDHCGANFNYFNDVVIDRSHIRLITTDTAFCDHHNQRNKFVNAHEYGHAYGIQFANVGEQNPHAEDHAIVPKGTCEFSGSWTYDNNTKEWSSIGIREGFAHFVSARIWNAHASDGQFKWGPNFDLERWDAGDTEGGYLVNNCCAGTAAQCAASLNGAATLADWMRAFWDIHTDTICTTADKTAIAELYKLTLSQAMLTDQNFFPASQAAIVSWSSTCKDQWKDFGCHNGIDRQGAPWSGC